MNVAPCATPNSLIRAIRGCSRLPYARAAADSACAIAAVAVSSGWNRLTANWRSKPATPNTFARETVPLGPIADRLEQLVAPDALRRTGGRCHRTPTVYDVAADDATRCRSYRCVRSCPRRERWHLEAWRAQSGLPRCRGSRAIDAMAYAREAEAGARRRQPDADERRPPDDARRRRPRRRAPRARRAGRRRRAAAERPPTAPSADAELEAADRAAEPRRARASRRPTQPARDAAGDAAGRRARAETVAMPARTARRAAGDADGRARRPTAAIGGVEDPTQMPGPREIPGGDPDDPARRPGRVPPGDSRSLRRARPTSSRSSTASRPS